MVVYAVLTQKEKVDSDLIVLKFENGKKLRYISFKESLLDIRLYALHINEMNNVETQFESLLNARVKDRVKFEGKIGTLRDMILSVKQNKVQIFVGVEQGARSNTNNILLLIIPSLRKKVQNWIVAN